MSKKIFLSFLTLTFLVAGVFLFISKVSAAVAPEDNTLCWTKKACTAARGNADAFIESDECPGYLEGNTENSQLKWGKCLAGNATKTQVSFGGEQYKTFNNIGDYIKTVYNYSLIILGILAVLMIIVSGIQYISSAGNQEMITNAKKRIGGALIGLALAYMSYTILGMINPNTINLRLPQVYMIREKPVVTIAEGEWCDAKEGSDTAIACENKSTAEVSYKCLKIGVGDGLEGPCAKVLNTTIDITLNLAMFGVGPIASVTKQSLTAGAKSLLVPKSYLAGPTIKAALKKEYIEIVKKGGGMVNVPGEGMMLEAATEEAINKGIVLPTLKIGSTFIGNVAVKTTGIYYGAQAALWTEDQMLEAIGSLAKKGYLNPGICTALAKDVPEGGLCDMDQNRCKEGKCIDFGSVTSLQCWTNSRIGVCSSGKVNSFCNSPSDCGEVASKGCIAFVNIGGNNIKGCSDGSYGAPCAENGNCDSGKCANGYCVRGNAGMGEGEYCIDNTECITPLYCYTVIPNNLAYSSADQSISYSGNPQPMQLNRTTIRRDAGTYTFTYIYANSRGICLNQNNFNAAAIVKYHPYSKWTNTELGNFEYPNSAENY